MIKLEEDSKPVDIEWVESLLALRKYKSLAGRSSVPKKGEFQISWPKEVGESSQKFTSQVGMVKGNRELICQTGKIVKTAKSGLIGHDRLEKRSRGLLVTIAVEKTGSSKVDSARGEIEDNVFLSSDNSEIMEELIQATVEVEKRRVLELWVADSDKDVVLTTLVTENKFAHSKVKVNGSNQGIRQSSRIKSKGSSSNSMRTRNAKLIGVESVSGNQVTESGSVEDEVANVIAIGSAVGFDFSEVEE
ncbi:hypothetical protein LWI29_018819 [Acer saccharum]|uniref:Uncharacterized protein n=1 Tax=Acer saccharum TaxID=4024 RepID=A0AA39SGL2_ACESA|nr:hypothetical protein LWI29_018819 [Acer saccharum]